MSLNWYWINIKRRVSCRSALSVNVLNNLVHSKIIKLQPGTNYIFSENRLATISICLARLFLEIGNHEYRVFNNIYDFIILFNLVRLVGVLIDWNL